jgi:hypothetical protein
MPSPRRGSSRTIPRASEAASSLGASSQHCPHCHSPLVKCNPAPTGASLRPRPVASPRSDEGPGAPRNEACRRRDALIPSSPLRNSDTQRFADVADTRRRRPTPYRDIRTRTQIDESAQGTCNCFVTSGLRPRSASRGPLPARCHSGIRKRRSRLMANTRWFVGASGDQYTPTGMANSARGMRSRWRNGPRTASVMAQPTTP